MSRRRTRICVSVVAALVTGAACARHPSPGSPAGPGASDAETWIRELLPRLSLEDRIAQLLVVPAQGGFANTHSPASRQLERHVGELHVGGVLVGTGTPLEVAGRVDHLQQAAAVPLLVAAEVEWGAGQLLPELVLGPDRRTAGGTVLPPAMALAATGAPISAELAGRVTAREARAVGVHWLLGPVADLAAGQPGAAAVVRSFGGEAAAAARHAEAWLRGAQAAGALVTVRHFPGEGSLRWEADELLPVLQADRAAIERDDLVPFGALIRGGAGAVMLSGAAVPAYTGDRTTPAALSSRIGDELLRRRLAFDGLVVTPPLTADFLRRVPALSPGEVAVQAVLAGADVLLAPADPVLTHRALVAAVRAGRIPYGRIEESVRRVLEAKARLGLMRRPEAALDSVSAIIAAPEHDDLAGRLAAESITLVRDSLGLLPLDPRRVHRIALIVVAPAEQAAAGEPLARALRAIYGSGVSWDRVSPGTADSVVDAIVTRAGAAQAVVLALLSPLDAPAARPPLASAARRLAGRVAGVNGRLVVASFGDPFGGAAAALAGTHVIAWQPHGTHAQAALARSLAGAAPIQGRLPLPLRPGALTAPTALSRPALEFELRPATPAEVGLDPALLPRLDALMLRGLAGGAAPGGALAVGRHGRLVALRGYGRLDLRQGFDVVTDSSLYDLASLTKVVATTSALALAVERGLVDLDAPVQRYIPEWRGSAAKEAVTVRNLMRHDAGLAAYSPLYESLRGRDQYRQRIAAMNLVYEPGTRTVYSDFGVILVALIIEQVTGEPLDRFLQRELFGPLGMRDTGFNPLEWPYGTASLGEESDQGSPPWLLPRIAPTERDQRTQVRGQVHDENAFALGGVAGHAGLFSSARDLAVFAQLLLNRGFYGGRRYFDPAVIASFTRRQSVGSSRGIGWDTPGENSSAGDYFTSSSFGHTGFTGTSLWVDPERDLFVVLLTNRVSLGRENQRHVALRRAVADAVQLAIRDQAVTTRAVDTEVRPH